MARTRNVLLALGALVSSVGTASVAHAQISDACQDKGAIGRPYACAAVIVAGGIVGQPGSFQTRTSPPNLDRFENHTGGVAEMYGSGTPGTGHAVAGGTFGRFGAKVEAELLFTDELPRADIGAHTVLRMLDEITVVGPTPGASATGTLTVKAGGSFSAKGGGATLSVAITSLSGLNWKPEYSEYIFYAGQPSVEKSYTLPALSVGQVFYLDSKLWVDTAVGNAVGEVKSGAADMTDGVELTFRFDDPQISLSALSGHDYSSAGSNPTNDAGASDAGAHDAASGDAASGDAAQGGSSSGRRKSNGGGGCSVGTAPRRESAPFMALFASALGALAARRRLVRLSRTCFTPDSEVSWPGTTTSHDGARHAASARALAVR